MLTRYKDVFSLIARLIVGGVFIFAGWAKLHDMAATISQFSQMGFGSFWAYLVTGVELVGGALVILGFYLELATAVLSIVMIVAVYKTYPLGFQMYSMPTVVLAALLALLASGGGRFGFGKVRK